MSSRFLTAPVLASFCAQLAKEAAPMAGILSHLQRPGTRAAGLAGLGSGFGLGLGAGALGGAALGGKKSYDEARARGASGLSSAGAALGGALGGAVRGAGRGALIGAGIGGAAGLAAPTRVLSGTKSLAKSDNVLGSLSNFGQRQVHSLTGWKPGGSNRSVERIGAGAAGARHALERAHASGDPAAVASATRALRSVEKTQNMGLTSVPGVVRSVRDHGLIPTVGAGLRGQWDASSGRDKALLLGLPALSAASAIGGSEGAGQPGKGERVGRVLGGALGGAVAPLSLAGGLVLGGALERAGGLAGRGVDKLRGQRPAVPQEPSRPPASEPGDTGQAAVEHVFGTGYTGGTGGLE